MTPATLATLKGPSPAVLVTVFSVYKDRALFVVSSWMNATANVTLDVDWPALDAEGGCSCRSVVAGRTAAGRRKREAVLHAGCQGRADYHSDAGRHAVKVDDSGSRVKSENMCGETKPEVVPGQLQTRREQG